MQKYPEPIVGAFIINPQGKLFLMKSHKWKNLYVVPGGHIEVGEEIEDALEREIKEETGLNIYDATFLNIREFISEKGFHEKKHMIFLNFLARTKSNNVILNNEAQEYVWIDPKQALNLPLEKYTKITIEEELIKFRLQDV